MIDYRHNHTPGINPHAAQRGVSSLYREYGVGMSGRLSPIQGDSSPILTQVIEWPWAEDDAGVAFDQANLWGVRTRCQHDGGGGEVDRWVAVPRTLPVGYTPVGRHGRIVPFIADHLGDDPFQGRVLNGYYGPAAIWPVRWRTPTGQYPTDLTDDGYLWVPMNLNQQTTNELSFSGGGGFWVNEHPNYYFIRSTANPHVGFRGARLVIGSSHSIMTAYFGWTDPADGSPAAIGDINILWSSSYAENVPTDEILSGLSAPAIGARMNYHFVIKTFSVVSLTTLSLSPRTDIPLWYFSSTRNKVAPGGIVLPP